MLTATTGAIAQEAPAGADVHRSPRPDETLAPCSDAYTSAMSSAEPFLGESLEWYRSTSKRDQKYEAHYGEHLYVLKRLDHVFNLGGSLDCRPSKAQVPAWLRTTASLLLWPIRWAKPLAPHAIAFTPAVTIRMLQTRSAPVRTPSYQPYATLQWLDTLNARPAREQIAAGHAPWINVAEFHVVIGHHSNGQEGCFFENEARPDDQCVRLDDEAPVVNVLNGSFSTNYIRAGSVLRSSRIHKSKEDQTALADRSVSVGAEFEQHVSMDEHLYGTYGRQRASVHAEGAVALWKLRMEAGLHGTKIFRLPEEAANHSWIGIAQVSLFVGRNGAWGGFVRYYSGQEYYNIAYRNHSTRWHYGVIHSRDGFFRFRASQ